MLELPPTDAASTCSMTSLVDFFLLRLRFFAVRGCVACVDGAGFTG